MESRSTPDVWDSSAVLLTADHEWRHVQLYDDHRVTKVPYALKLPEQQTGQEVTHPFAALPATRSLVMQLLEGRLTNQTDALSWFQSRSD
ncbi:MAG: hypothetical protein H6981_07515 [Gammaproteobacteria bacterium]|nr:hypothetical protein [Gammaproteobacteria bacterium]MCP5136631.1 hypothetical protein [Gammaproteobacteria bacterium]